MQDKSHQYYFISYLLNGEFPSTLSNSGEQNHSLVHVPILSRQPARNLACTIPCLPLMPLLSLNILDFGYAFPSLPHSSSMKNVNKYTQTYTCINSEIQMISIIQFSYFKQSLFPVCQCSSLFTLILKFCSRKFVAIVMFSNFFSHTGCYNNLEACRTYITLKTFCNINA